MKSFLPLMTIVLLLISYKVDLYAFLSPIVLYFTLGAIGFCIYFTKFLNGGNSTS